MVSQVAESKLRVDTPVSNEIAVLSVFNDGFGSFLGAAHCKFFFAKDKDDGGRD